MYVSLLAKHVVHCFSLVLSSIGFNLLSSPPSLHEGFVLPAIQQLLFQTDRPKKKKKKKRKKTVIHTYFSVTNKRQAFYIADSQSSSVFESDCVGRRATSRRRRQPLMIHYRDENKRIERKNDKKKVKDRERKREVAV
ncbi:MAG: hypothetical protein J3Q66DRAFT_136564 [Benniella sp.]|nr:MAG: hypothetical protein J3Q66DRAFT_136564 [Benniella sp.]